MDSPLSFLASEALDRPSHTSKMLSLTPVMSPSSSDITICNSSLAVLFATLFDQSV
jgi:hypothetical protein